jgi:hypothetical protein
VLPSGVRYPVPLRREAREVPARRPQVSTST